MRLRTSFLPVALAAGVLAATSLEGRADSGTLKKVEFDQANLEEVLEFFRNAGGKAPNILVDPKVNQETKVTLTLHDVSPGAAFAYVAEIAGFDYREEKHALRIVPRRAPPTAKAFLKRGSAATSRRAAAIKFPKVEWEEAELRDVVAEIAAASRALDPRKKGLNIVLSRGVDPATPVTLSLQNVPASTVLKYVAEFARLRLRADGPAIVFMPRKKVGQ